MKIILDKIYEGDIFTQKYKEEEEWCLQKDSLYGEVTQQGINTIVDELKKHGFFKNIKFYDIGCGNGRAVLHLGMYDEVEKASGIDLFKSKIDYSKQIIYKSSYPNLSKINLEYGNALDVKDFFEYNLFLFNNVSWSDETNTAFFNKIKKDSIIITTIGMLKFENKFIKNLLKLKVLYSWNKRGPGVCYIYRKI